MSYIGKWFGFGKNERFDEALRAYEAGDFGAAVDGLRSVSQTESDLTLRQRSKSYLAGALGRMGKEAYAQGDHRLAIHYLSEAVVLRPRYADLHMALAYAHDAVHEFAKRNQEVDAALRINPKYGLAVLFQAALLISSGERANGLARAVQAVSLDRRLETSVFREGIALADSGDWEGASQKFRQIRPTGNDDPDFLAIRGDRMMASRRFEDASECYRHAIELMPGYADLRVRHGQALLETDQVQRAIDEFREATAINPQYAEAFALLGVALRRQQDETAALEAFRHALDIDPNQVIAAQEVVRRRM